MNFVPYLKLNLKMVSGDLVLIGVCGILFCCLIWTIIGVIFLPWIMLGITFLSVKPTKKVYEESLFGQSSALHMSLPVSAREMVAAKLLVGALILLVTLAAAFGPLIITGFNIWAFGIDDLMQAAGGGSRAELLIWVFLLDLLLLILLVDCVGFTGSIWLRKKHTWNRSKGTQTALRTLAAAPFLLFLLWQNTKAEDVTPLQDLFASEFCMMVLVAVAVLEIVMYVLAAGISVRLVEKGRVI